MGYLKHKSFGKPTAYGIKGINEFNAGSLSVEIKNILDKIIAFNKRIRN